MKKGKKTFRRLLSFLLVICMMFGNLFVAEANTTTESGQTEYSVRIPHTKTDGTMNKFTFAEGKWAAGNNNHTWSNDPSQSAPQETYYEVKFYGHKIEIYAGKNAPMGKVKYTIDGNPVQANGVTDGIFDLYRSSNIDSTHIVTVDGLDEGEHTFRAEATYTKNDSATGYKIDAAEVIVYHNGYNVTAIHTTQDSYQLNQYQTVDLSYTVTPDYADATGLTFASDNEDVVTVTDKGVMEGIGAGTANVTITSKLSPEVKKTVRVTVIEQPAQMKGSIVDENLQWTQEKYTKVTTETAVMSEEVSTWKNDIAVSEISLASVESKLKNVTVTASDFTGANNTKIEKENISLNFIKSVQAYTGMPGYASTTRPVPQGDRKEGNEVVYQDTSVGIDVPYNQLQNVWVSIQVPKDTPAGSYTGTITATAENVDTPLIFHYTVNVADVELPEEETFGQTGGFDIELWQNPYASAHYYEVTPFSPEHFEILKPIMEKYKSIGGYSVTTTIVDEAWQGQTYRGEEEIKFPSMVKWTKKTDGSWAFDFTDFDKWVQFNKDLGIGQKIVCYSIAPWTNAVRYTNEATGKVVNQGLTVGTELWREMWTAFLEALIDHLNEKDWFHETYIGIDERGFDARTFDLIDSVVNMDLAPNMEPLKTAGAMDGFKDKPALALRVDDLNVGSIAIKAHPVEFENIRKQREDLGLKTTMYTCTGHAPGNFSLSAPGESYWTMMYAMSVNAEGYLRWAYDSWVENPLEDATHNAFEAGDCFLIYPDPKGTQNPEINSSTRLEKMAEGVRDVNKLLIMKENAPVLEEEILDLVANAKATYATSGYYLTEDGKTALANDMKTIKEGIASLTERYVDLMKNASGTVESISIDSPKTTLAVGETADFDVTFQPENVINTKVTWTSSNEAVATVSKTGVVTALRAGTTEIKAVSLLDPEKTDSVTVTVEQFKVDAGKQVSYYSFDEEDAKDAWGNRNGTVTGATFVDGRSGKAVQIASGNKIEFPENTTLEDDWTISYWVYLETVPSSRSSILGSKDGARTINLRMPASGSVGVNVGTGTGDILSFGNYSITSGNWIHMTWTNSNTNGLKLYVNGELKQTNTWTAGNNNMFKAPIDVLGATGFTGKVDELKIYNCELNTEEIAAAMLTSGLNIAQTSVELKLGTSYAISTNLISNQEDKTITFESLNPEVLTVDEYGRVTTLKRGTATVVVENKAGGFREEVTFTVTKDLVIQYTIPEYTMPDEFMSDVKKFEDKNNKYNSQYIGQPDMIMLKDEKTLFTAFPVGHGHGPLIMMKSTDAGETWVEKENIPASWANSQETPTLYRLDFTDGSTKLMLIAGRPHWNSPNTAIGGWDTSISNDNGETWSEFKRHHETLPNGDKNWTIVAMSSMVQLKNSEGEYIDKWMAIYHNYNYVNYKTYLTFDEDGNEQWTTPVPMMPEHRDMESMTQLCEIGLFRSPDGKRIVGLARSQTHNHKSTMFYSDDEGETWSKPEYVHGSLQGERHKAVYDPISGRLFISFREIILDYDNDGQIENNDWMAGDWVAWVGTYEDIMDQNEGEYRILMDEDWANNAKSGDTGYPGLIVTSDGTIVINTYGHWDKEFSLNYKPYDVRTDRCYIRQAKFTFGEVENAWGLVKYDKIQETVNTMKAVENDSYDAEGWAAFTEALKKAEDAMENKVLQQVQIDVLEEELKEAYDALKPENGGNQGGDEPGGDNTGGDQGGSQEEEAQKELAAAKEALAQVVAGTAGKKAEDYTKESWADYQAALQNAQNVAAKAEATKAEIEAAKAALEKAIADLKAAIPTPPGGDQSGGNQPGGQQPGGNTDPAQKEVETAKTQLNQVMKGAGVKAESTYTKESFAAYQNALQAAQAVLSKANATKEEVTAAQTALQKAIAGLIAAPVQAPGQTTPSTEKGTKFEDAKGIYQFKIKNEKEAVFTGVSKSIKTVKIANTVTYAGKTFQVTEVAAKALKDDKIVTKVMVGKNVKTIGASAFEGCVKLSSISLGNNTTKIGNKALKGCKALKKVTVPKKVTNLGKSVFEGCTKLSTITIKATGLKKVGKNTFKGISAKAKVKVPKKNLAKYKKLLKNKGQGKKVSIK